MNGNETTIAMVETPSIEKGTSNEQKTKVFKVKPLVNFSYDVGSRFKGFTKTALKKVKSFDHFIAEEHAGRIVSYKSLSVIVIENDKETDVKETENSGVFSPAQLALLQSSDYSSNLLIKANYTEKSFHTGALEESTWTPYITVVPEKQAAYAWGKEALIYYFEKHTREATANLTTDQIKSGQLYFTVSKDGTVSNAEIISTSGFPKVDEKVKELIFNLPGSWQPAENANGDKLNQTLVISFGKMGC
jgi:hypothetical protein